MTCMTSSQCKRRKIIGNSEFRILEFRNSDDNHDFRNKHSNPLDVSLHQRTRQTKVEKKLVKTERAKIKVENTRQNRTCKNKS